jgi:hypothetical protein
VLPDMFHELDKWVFIVQLIYIGMPDYTAFNTYIIHEFHLETPASPGPTPVGLFKYLYLFIVYYSMSL